MSHSARRHRVTPRGSRAPERHAQMAQRLHKRAELCAAVWANDYLNPEEAAIPPNVHPATVRRACNDGDLAHTHVGTGLKLIRIATADLRSYLDGTSPKTGPCAICVANRRGKKPNPPPKPRTGKTRSSGVFEQSSTSSAA